jgi:hypothetical protein
VIGNRTIENSYNRKGYRGIGKAAIEEYGKGYRIIKK